MADTAYPLPVRGIPLRFPVLALPSLLEAVERLVAVGGRGDGVFVAADRHPVTLEDVLAAFREGLARPARLIGLPRLVLAAAIRTTGGALAAAQDCDSSALQALGWSPEADTLSNLRILAAQRHAFRTLPSNAGVGEVE
jgi:UDP-glucose 4-epimerase